MNKEFKISEEEKKAIVSYLSGEMSADDAGVLNHWLEKNTENKRLLDQFTDIWSSSFYLKAEKSIDTSKAWNDIQKQLHIQKKNIITTGRKEIIRIAAVFIAALFIGGLGYHFISRDHKKDITLNRYVQYVSPLGSRSFVQLSDGSKVWLNAGSTLRYMESYGKSDRELQLTGEAFFEVEKNKELPFVVKTSEINVIALGTQFNVKAYAEEKTIETTLIKGSVKLESTTVKLADNLVLKPSEKAVYTRKNQTVELIVQQNDTKETTAKPKLEIIESVETEPIISWKDKRWVISNEKLGDLAIKLERRFDVNFIFDNEILKEYSFRGTLEDENLGQIMDAICFSSPVKYVIEDKTVYVMPDGHKMEKFKKLLME